MSQLPRHGRIDVHHHFIPPKVFSDEMANAIAWRFPVENMPWTPEVSMRAMDALGIDLAVLSTAAEGDGPLGEQGRRAAREMNLSLAKICADHPARFSFFATLPNLSDTEGALMELAYALDHLHADGIAFPSSYGIGKDAKYLGDDSYDPIWEELNRRGTVVFIHGTQTPSSTPWPHVFLGLPVTEVPNETYKAAAHLVVTGKKRRWPRVKIILSHLGGAVPSLAPRVAVLARHMGCALTSDELMEDFASFYFDTALAAHETTLTGAETFLKPGHLLFGSDFPAISTDMAQWYKDNVDKFYADKPRKLTDVMYENALGLFPNVRRKLGW